MNYGITENGFNRKTYGNILNELYGRLNEAFGEIDTDPDGALGQICRSVAYTDAELWEIMESVYLSNDVRTASGSDLDRVAAYLGHYRRQATRASSSIYIGGSAGEVIPSGTTVSQSITGRQFLTDSEVTLSYNTTYKFELTWDSINEIQVVINGRTVSGNTLDDFITDLNNNAGTTGTGIIEKLSDTELSVTSFRILAPFDLDPVVSGCTIDRIYGLTTCTAISDGVVVIPRDSIDSITAAGFEVTNPINGSAGTLDEDDVAFRNRIVILHQMGSSCTEKAIEAKLWKNVDNVSEVAVFSNRRDTEDKYGREAHSVNVVIEGGSTEQIAQIIYDNTAAGIGFSGAEQFTIDDTMVKFDRVKSLFGWVRVRILAKNREEAYPSDADNLIRQAVYNEAVRFTKLGADIVAQKLLGGIYRNVTGLSNVLVEVATTETDADTPTEWKSIIDVAPTDKVEFRDTLNPKRIIIIDEDK